MKPTPLLLLLALLAGCAGAPPRPAAVPRGDYAAVERYGAALIRHEMDRNAVTGLSIALIDDQRVVWAQGFGDADKAKGIAATPDTLYRVGSVSKLFTDMAALQLAEAGKLDIDQPLRNYLPGFSIRSRDADAPPITLRELMTHHAGLPRDVMKGFMSSHPASFATVVEDLRGTETAYPPGLVFSYSNVGLSLLGDVVQTVSGEPFADHMRAALLEPLGMTHSRFEPGPSADPLMAKGYRKGNEETDPSLRDVPAGGLTSSVTDLSRFVSMVFAGGKAGGRTILEPGTVAGMLRPQNLDVPLDFNFRIGLGWMLSTLGTSTIRNAGPVAHHAGGTVLFHSQMYLLPEHRLGVVVLSNSSTGRPVVDRVATEVLGLALEAKTGIRQPDRPKPALSSQPVSDRLAHELAGDYTTAAGFVRIRAEGDRLHAEIGGRDFNVVQRDDGQFGLDYALLGLLHVDLGTLGEVGFSRRRVAGRDLLVARIGEQEMLVGERIDPPARLGAWRQRLGDYEIANLGDDHRFIDRIRLQEEHGFLIAELALADAPGMPQRIPLMPLSDGEALLLGPIAGGGDTIGVVPVEGEEQLAVSGYRLRKTGR